MKTISWIVFFFGLMAINLSQGSSTPSSAVNAGTVFYFAGVTCPAGSVTADGSSQLRSGKFAGLFSAIGTTWGSADGTHFTLPPLQNRFIRGAGSATDGNGGTSVALGVFQDHTTAKNGLSVSIGSSTTGISVGVPTLNTGGSANGANALGANGANSSAVTSISDPGHSHSASVSGDSETRPKSYGVTVCIKF